LFGLRLFGSGRGVLALRPFVSRDFWTMAGPSSRPSLFVLPSQGQAAWFAFAQTPEFRSRTTNCGSNIHRLNRSHLLTFIGRGCGPKPTETRRFEESAVLSKIRPSRPWWREKAAWIFLSLILSAATTAAPRSHLDRPQRCGWSQPPLRNRARRSAQREVVGKRD
jgi:hypothetical protein